MVVTNVIIARGSGIVSVAYNAEIPRVITTEPCASPETIVVVQRAVVDRSGDALTA